MTITNMEVVRILDEMSSLGLKLSEAWEADGNRDGDLFSAMPFKCSLDEWPFEVEQLSREYGCLPDNPADDLKPTAIIEELVAQMGGEADFDNVVQVVAIQRAQAYLKRASFTPRSGSIEQALLEALRDCLELLEADESNDEWAREFAKPKADAARAAIAAAERANL